MALKRNKKAKNPNSRPMKVEVEEFAIIKENKKVLEILDRMEEDNRNKWWRKWIKWK